MIYYLIFIFLISCSFVEETKKEIKKLVADTKNELSNISNIQKELDKMSSHFTKDFLTEKKKEDQFLLITSLKDKDYEKAKSYLTNKTELNRLNKKGLSPLILMSKQANLEWMNLLLESGADIHLADHKGYPPIFYASNLESFNLLKEKGADIEHETQSGDKLIHAASYLGHKEILKLLLEEKDFDPNQKNNLGRTPWHLAVCSGDLDSFNLLNKKGINFKLKDKSNMTGLHIAVSCNRPHMLDHLLPHIDPNIKNILGQTALHQASLRASVEMSEKLIPKTDLYLTNNEGKTALDELDGKGHTELENLLKKAMGL